MNKIEYGTEFLDQLKDKVHEQQWEIERLTAESTEWESKFYKEVAKNNKAIEYIENCSGIYKNALGEKKQMISSQNVLDILKGVGKRVNIEKAIDRIKGGLYIRDMIEDDEDKKEYDEFVRDLLKDLGAWNE